MCLQIIPGGEDEGKEQGRMRQRAMIQYIPATAATPICWAYTQHIWVEKLMLRFRCIMQQTVQHELQQGLQLNTALKASLSTSPTLGSIATSLLSNTCDYSQHTWSKMWPKWPSFCSPSNVIDPEAPGTEIHGSEFIFHSRFWRLHPCLIQNSRLRMRHLSAACLGLAPHKWG